MHGSPQNIKILLYIVLWGIFSVIENLWNLLFAVFLLSLPPPPIFPVSLDMIQCTDFFIFCRETTELLCSRRAQPPTRWYAKLELSRNMYTLHTRFMHIWHPICMLSRWLVTRFLHRSSVGSLLKVHCWLGERRRRESYDEKTSSLP